MEYTIEIDVAAPLERVATAFMNPAEWPAWQLGLVAVETEPGPSAPARGARRTLRFELPGWSTTLLETLLEQEFPLAYTASYSSGPAWNLCENTFTEQPGGTHWLQRNTWRFDDVIATDDDAERFAVTSRAAMEALRAWVERGERVAGPA